MSTGQRHYHLMGLGGIGVSGLAQILHHDQHRVSGCDQQHSPLLDRLGQLGIQTHLGHHPDHLAGVDVLVASTAILESEPELREARLRGIRVLRRVELLGELLAQGFSLGITGSHGKTTTSAMLASILIAAKTDPTVILGANWPPLGGNARYGYGPYRLAEVDESDPWFQNLHLQVAVVLNLEPDHVGQSTDLRPNYHADYASLQSAIQTFAHNAHTVLYNADWPGLASLMPQGATVFGLEQGDCHTRHLHLEALGSRFEVCWRGQMLGTVQLRVPGQHNVYNALAAIATALQVGLPFEAIRLGLEQFRGPHRRFEWLGEYQQAWVVDDYAHNPTKVAALLEAAQQSGRRVRAVFQPHRYLRTQQQWPGFVQSLKLADEVIVLDIYAAGEAPIPGISAQLIVQGLLDAGRTARHAPWDQALDYLRTTAQPNDLILTIGAGDVVRLGLELVHGKEAS